MQELTRAQQEYFKNSKIRDVNNNLQVFYHATNKEFEAFDKSYIGTGHKSMYGKGFYFSSEPLPAYGENIPVYLDIKQPYVLDVMDRDNMKDFAQKLGIDYGELYGLICHYSTKMPKLGIHQALQNNNAENLQGLKDKGYDGLIILNAQVGGFWKRDANGKVSRTPKSIIDKEVIAFEPNQIKAIENLYPTKSDNFKDNSQEYLQEHLKDMSVDEACAIAKHIKQMEKQNRTQLAKENNRGENYEI